MALKNGLDFNNNGNSINLVVAPANKYLKINIDILSGLMNKDLKLIYLTTNKSCEVISSTLEKNKIKFNDILFIETKEHGISGKPHCLFVQSPEALTDMSIAICQTFQVFNKNKFLFFDTLSSLFVYNDPKVVVRFANFLVHKMRQHHVRGAFICIKKEIDEKVISQLSQVFDNVVEIGENGGAK